jgi:hypothetical protein
MVLPKTVALIADRLNSTGATWMATGSIAAMTYGEYRTTNDVDVILTLAPSDAAKIVAAFPLEEFYCPPLDVISLEAARTEHGHFNLLHHDTGFKADIYLAGSDELTRWALAHRQEIPLGKSVVWLAPPEYVIVNKLEFYREGSSEKHLRDIRGMLAVTDVDQPFLEKEIAARGLEDVWQAVEKRASGT